MRALPAEDLQEFMTAGCPSPSSCSAHSLFLGIPRKHPYSGRLVLGLSFRILQFSEELGSTQSPVKTVTPTDGGTGFPLPPQRPPFYRSAVRGDRARRGRKLINETSRVGIGRPSPRFPAPRGRGEVLLQAGAKCCLSITATPAPNQKLKWAEHGAQLSS